VICGADSEYKRTRGIVAIIAGEGAAESLRLLLPSLRPGNGLAFILMQRAAPLGENFFREVLSRPDSLQVVEVADGTRLRPDGLHLLPAGHAATFAHGTLRLRPLAAEGRRRDLASLLLRTLVRGHRARSAAIFLSGAAPQGIGGALSIRAAGGLVLVQDPAEARADILPRAAMQAHAADAVLPAAAMHAALLAHADRLPVEAGDALPAILALLQPETPQELQLYRPATLGLRVRHRMVALRLDQPRYLARLREDGAERAQLTRDILVHVGAFFRDRAMLRQFARQGLPALLAARPPHLPLRLWVAGCGTGEEAWSLLILARQAVARAGLSTPLQLIASDLSAEALAAARAALYPPSITESVSAERLAACFEREAGGWRVRPELRALAIFTRHDALADPPFAGLDAIACGPLLRHLRPERRPALLARLAGALRPGGLLLGVGEAEAAALGWPPLPPPPGLMAAEGLWRRPLDGPVPPAEASPAELERRALHEELAQRAQEQTTALSLARAARADLRNLAAATGAYLLLLDPWLRLRFRTEAAGSAFGIGVGEVGRPLDQLQGLPPDPGLAADAVRVMREGGAAEARLRTAAGAVFRRRVQPYRAEDGSTDGVVLGYTDVTQGAEAEQALEAARAEREAAQAARARFLALTEQDLGSPLRSLQRLHRLLGRVVQDADALRLLRLQGAALADLSGLLARLVQGQGPAAGALVPEVEAVPLAGLFARLAEGAGLAALRLRAGPHAVLTDPILTERLLDGLLVHAVAAAGEAAGEGGRFLLGARRQGGVVRIALWSRRSPAAPRGQEALRALEAQRRLEPLRALAVLLGHRLRAEAAPPRQGPWFVLDLPPGGASAAGDGAAAPPRRAGRILVLEPDAQERALLLHELAAEGHLATGAPDRAAALERLRREEERPDLLIAGPGTAPGEAAALAAGLRARFATTPAVLALGAEGEPGSDIPRLPHPPGSQALGLLVQRLLAPPPPEPSAPPPPRGTVHLLLADAVLRGDLRRLVERDGYAVQEHASAEAFLAAYRAAPHSALVLDGTLPGMAGLDLLTTLRGLGDAMPAVMLTDFADVPAAVQALRAGASDVLEKPVRPSALLNVLGHLRARAAERVAFVGARGDSARRIAQLTPRQRDIMNRVLAGQASKAIAADLCISRRTVETHRASIMRRLGVRSLPALARLALAATQGG